jgi:hypothetical protein
MRQTMSMSAVQAAKAYLNGDSIITFDLELVRIGRVESES